MSGPSMGIAGGALSPYLTRRGFLAAGVAATAPLVLGGCGPSDPPGSGQQLPAWVPTSPASSFQIAGWVEQPSVVAGDAIALHVNGRGANAGATAFVEVWRTGWHGGLGGQQYLASAPVTLGPEQPMRTITHPQTGLDEAEWPLTTTIVTETAGVPWPSGVYVVRLTGADGRQALVPVTIRDRTPSAPVLVVQGHLTWQAYNVGYRHLYDGGSAVSFRRPYYFDNAKVSFGAGEYLWMEHRVVRWLERTGFAATHTADLDLHASPVPASTKVIVLAGHTEYWTRQMRDHLRDAMARGVGVVNLSANAVYWRGRIEPWRGGIRYDCYKTDSGYASPADPLAADPDRATMTFRNTGEPEQALFGVMFDGWVDAPEYVPGPSNYSYPLTCVDTSHPVFAGTGIVAGESFDALCAGEVDARLVPYGQVPDATLAFRAELPFVVGNRKDPAAPVVAESVLFEKALGPVPARVFSAGSYGWAYGLDDLSFDPYTYRFANAKISRLTERIIRWAMHEW